MLITVNLVLIALLWATGADTTTRDAGDVFELAGEVAIYADERLEAAAVGDDLPAAPSLQASQPALALALTTALGMNVLLVGVVAWMTRHRVVELLRRVGLLEPFRTRDLWRPLVAVAGCYVVVVAYASIVDALGIGVLQPESTLPYEVLRNPLTIVLAGIAVVVAAPVGEEVFYRGLIFGGLQRWGFWPAALISAAVFSGTHLDSGSLIPFFIIGVTLAWLFWRRGNLWESVAFHMLFNAFSFSLLLATEA